MSNIINILPELTPQPCAFAPSATSGYHCSSHSRKGKEFENSFPLHEIIPTRFVSVFISW